MCVFKNHVFIYFLRPPSWSGTEAMSLKSCQVSQVERGTACGREDDLGTGPSANCQKYLQVWKGRYAKPSAFIHDFVSWAESYKANVVFEEKWFSLFDSEAISGCETRQFQALLRPFLQKEPAHNSVKT
jgi:hypothetical protein